MKDVLAIDLGTSTGFCYNRGDTTFQGSWLLATDKEIRAWGKARLRRRKDPRVERLCIKLDALGNFDVVIFEDVQFGSTTYQTQLWAGLRSSVWLCAAKSGIAECVPVSTLKLFATGNGHATKEMMFAALAKKHPNLAGGLANNDDAVDAAWLWVWAKEKLIWSK